MLLFIIFTLTNNPTTILPFPLISFILFHSMLCVKRGVEMLRFKRWISFSQMGVNASIVQQLEKQNIIEATPIQEKVNGIYTPLIV